MYSTRISLSLIAGASRPSGVLQIAIDQQRRQESHAAAGHQHDVAYRAFKRPDAEHGRWQNVEPVGRAERFVLDQQPVEDHRQRQAQQAEENAAITRQQEAQDERHQSGDQSPGDHLHQHVADIEKPAEAAGGVCADAVVQRLAERQQSRPQQQHQAERHQALGDRDGKQEHCPLRQQRPRRRPPPAGRCPESGSVRSRLIFCAARRD